MLKLSLNKQPRFVHWFALLLLSLAFFALFNAIRLPAALLLGAMLAAIAIAIAEGAPRVARPFFIMAQGTVGCLVARGITPEILVSLREGWMIFVSVTLMVILACVWMGWILARKRILPGATAIWGCSPGGASVMTLMSNDYGADMRLVAVMQYMRVVVVTLLATLISRFWMGGMLPAQGTFLDGLSAIVWSDLAATLLLAGGSASLASFLRIPGGSLLAPLIIGSVLQTQGFLTITLPPWILAPAYLILGWSIGLRFTRQALVQVSKALPAIFLSIVCMVAACVGVAIALTHVADIDPLTAYLATSPGGLDSVAIIAATSGVDVSFVMAFQTARLLLVILLGPALARFMARRL